MSLIQYFKEIVIAWKITIFIVLFLTWPLSAYLIYHNEPQLFIELDSLKLTLLACAISAPFLLINTLITLFITYPKDPKEKSVDQLLSRTVVVGAIFTTFILCIGTLMSFFGSKLNIVISAMGFLELIYLGSIIVAAIKERK